MRSATPTFQGDRLRMQRKVHYLTQEQLAREIGVTVRTANAWENGSEPAPKHLRKLAELFKTDPLFFYLDGQVAA